MTQARLIYAPRDAWLVCYCAYPHASQDSWRKS